MIAIIVWLLFDGTFRGAVGERRRGDRDSVIAETSCCRVPTILALDQAVGISHHVMAVAVQGAPAVDKIAMSVTATHQKFKWHSARSAHPALSINAFGQNELLENRQRLCRFGV
jgi:hypothetical protein